MPSINPHSHTRDDPVSAFFQGLIHAAIYKRSQGRITRQVTFAAIAITVVLGVWQLSDVLIDLDPGFRLGMADALFLGLFRYGIPGVLLLAGGWIAYRVVNFPSFADFLIAVEAEMNKVSWPSRHELFRASMVVLCTIFFLAAVLATFDFVWRVLFTKVLGIF
ncbi:MAG: preprotein translocase subunit SecE [Pirellulales bacterium]|nr:preprotein translocase subunit SecE [Pirellulales bacterium]